MSAPRTDTTKPLLFAGCLCVASSWPSSACSPPGGRRCPPGSISPIVFGSPRPRLAAQGAARGQWRHRRLGGVPRTLSARLCKLVMDVSGWKGLRRSGYVPLAKAEARPTRGGFAQGWGARADTDALSVESRAPGLTGSWWAEDGPFRPGAIRAARYLGTESSTAALPPRRRSTTTPTPKTSTTAAPMIAHISTGRHDSSLPSVMAFWESEICSWT